MDNKENQNQLLIEAEIDVQEEKPDQLVVNTNLDASDSSDIEIIAVSENIALGKRNKFSSPIYNRRKTKVSINSVNSMKQQSYIKEEIIISDGSDCSDTEGDKFKPSYSNGMRSEKLQIILQKKKRINSNKSLSAIILNCPRCNKTEKVFSITLMSTCKDCNVNMSYVCNKCNNRYESMSALYRHKKLQCHAIKAKRKNTKKHLDLSEMFLTRCNKCAVVRKLKKKQTKCSSCKATMIYECSVCSKSYCSYSGIYLHVRRFCQPKVKSYYCNDCSFRANKADTLQRHLVRNHPDLYRDVINCSKCRRSFEHPIYLELHEPLCGLPHFTCKFCTYKPKSCSSLEKHLLLRHAEQVKIEGLENILEQVTSLKVENNDKAVVVTNSEEGDVSQFDLFHLRQLHCPKCEKSFDFVHNSSPCEICQGAVLYECGGCSRTYETVNSLHRHLRRSHAKIRYSCKICNRGFTSFNDANEHRRICSQEQPYECKLCPFKTRYKSSLSAHTSKLHNSHRRAFECGSCHIIYKTSRAMKRHVRLCTAYLQN